jgi:hypothetical protein
MQHLVWQGPTCFDIQDQHQSDVRGLITGFFELSKGESDFIQPGALLLWTRSDTSDNLLQLWIVPHSEKGQTQMASSAHLVKCRKNVYRGLIRAISIDWRVSCAC